MSKRMLFNCLFAGVSAVVYAQPAQILLVPEKDYNAYLLIDKDKAYYKFRQLDKPSYFRDVDTLMKISEKHYQGKNSDLFLEDKRYLKLRSGKCIQMVIATKEQVRRWNYYHNFDLYNSFVSKVNQKKDSMKSHDQYHQLNEEWMLLLQKMDDLDLSSFRKELDMFIMKYEIN